MRTFWMCASVAPWRKPGERHAVVAKITKPAGFIGGRHACGSACVARRKSQRAFQHWLRTRDLPRAHATGLHSPAMALDPALDNEVRSLIDDYRERCLWFVRSDYYPSSPDEIRRVLQWIRDRGDREAFLRAGKIEQWLSRISSERSAVS